MSKHDGYIYAFTRDYIMSRVKIGSSKNWEKRLWEANHSPWNCGETWHCLAILDRSSCQEDRTFHRWLAKKHPEIGQTKIQEFYNMTPNMVFDLFGEYAEDRGSVGRKITMNPAEEPCFEKNTYRFIPHNDVKYCIPEESLNHDWRKAKKLTLSERNIPYGSVLDFIPDSTKHCTVVGTSEVMFNGTRYNTLTDLTQNILGKRASGTSFWKYRGKAVNEMR